MRIERNIEENNIDIWVESSEKANYKSAPAYLGALQESKDKGMKVCVYIGGELPLLPVIDEMLAPNPITA